MRRWYKAKQPERPKSSTYHYGFGNFSQRRINITFDQYKWRIISSWHHRSLALLEIIRCLFDIKYISYAYTSSPWIKTLISLNKMTRPRSQTMNILCIIYHFRMFCVCTMYVYYGNDIKCNLVKVWFIAVNKLVVQSVAIAFQWFEGLYRMVIFCLFGKPILYRIS